MEKTREYFRSMVSQRGIKQTFYDGPSEYNASWDYNVSPEGRHFLSICAEGPKTDAMLYEYIPETCELKPCLDTKKDVMLYPRTIRPSKIHTCMDFMEDGRIIMNNHTTAGAPAHPDWQVEAYWNHTWEGFPGSSVFIYDPKTGKTEDLGIPVPRESIYGGAYDPIHRAYYFSGYFRGHGYRLDLDTRKVTDYGQFTEFGTYFHIKGPDGNIYLSTRRGRMLRYNVHTQEAEILNAEIPVDETIWDDSRRHNVMAYAAFGPDKKLYLCAHHHETVFCYDIEKDEMTPVGSPVPSWYRDQYKGLYLLFGMDFDSKGVLWYGLKILGNCMRLISWDIFNGGEPVDHGIIGTPSNAAWNFCQIHIVDDVLYGSTTNHAVDGPAMIAIDLNIMNEDVDKPRERAWDKIVYRGTADADIYPGEEKLTGPAAVDATGGVHKEAKKERVHGGSAFADGIRTAKPKNNKFYLVTQSYYVTKLWKIIGDKASQVVDISHDENGNVVAISGNADNGFYRFVINKSKFLSYEKIDYTPVDPNVVKEKYKDCILPAQAGRSWIAYATAEAPLADGSMLVGTQAGGLAIVKDGKAFSLGFVSDTGAIHSLTSSPDKKTVYGVCGDKEDYGLVFSYSMEVGIACHGGLYFEQGASSDDGLGISCEPYRIDYAPDGKSIAIGVRDRMGAVYEYYFDE